MGGSKLRFIEKKLKNNENIGLFLFLDKIESRKFTPIYVSLGTFNFYQMKA